MAMDQLVLQYLKEKGILPGTVVPGGMAGGDLPPVSNAPLSGPAQTVDPAPPKQYPQPSNATGNQLQSPTEPRTITLPGTESFMNPGQPGMAQLGATPAPDVVAATAASMQTAQEQARHGQQSWGLDSKGQPLITEGYDASAAASQKRSEQEAAEGERQKQAQTQRDQAMKYIAMVAPQAYAQMTQQQQLSQQMSNTPLQPGQQRTQDSTGKTTLTSQGPPRVQNINDLGPASPGMQWAQSVDAKGQPSYRQTQTPVSASPVRQIDPGLKSVAEIIPDPKNPGQTLYQTWMKEGRGPNTDEIGVLTKGLEAKAKRPIDAKMGGMDIPGLANSYASGLLGPGQIRGTMGMPVVAQVQSEVIKQFPNFNHELAAANEQWAKNPNNLRTMGMIGGTLPRLDALEQQITKMPNTNVPITNQFLRQLSIQTGDPAFTNFESNRNAIVQEVNTALSGSSTGSDLRIKIELENLAGSRSPAQLRGAIENLRHALEARQDVTMSPLYPPEVLQGKMSQQQYLQQIRAGGKQGGALARVAPVTDSIINPQSQGLTPEHKARLRSGGARPGDTVTIGGQTRQLTVQDLQ